MDKGDQNVGNCPYCTKIIFKEGVFNSEASFSTRCPHCQKTVKVHVKTKLEIKITPQEKPSEARGGVTVSKTH